MNEYEKAKLFYIRSGLNISEKYDFSGTRITLKEYHELIKKEKND